MSWENEHRKTLCAFHPLISIWGDVCRIYTSLSLAFICRLLNSDVTQMSLLLSHGYLPTTAYILSSILKAFIETKTSSSINLKKLNYMSSRSEMRLYKGTTFALLFVLHFESLKSFLGQRKRRNDTACHWLHLQELAVIFTRWWQKAGRLHLVTIWPRLWPVFLFKDNFNNYLSTKKCS